MGEQKTVIVRDYTNELEDLEITDKDAQTAAAIIKSIDYLCSLPHMIDPTAKTNFDKLVDVCDAIAQDFFGKMTATVDWEYYEASIELELDYIEFYQDLSMDDFYLLVDAANSIRIFATPTNRFCIRAYLPYFVLLT